MGLIQNINNLVSSGTLSKESIDRLESLLNDEKLQELNDAIESLSDTKNLLGFSWLGELSEYPTDPKNGMMFRSSVNKNIYIYFNSWVLLIESPIPKNGLSAYELAVILGYSGTQEQWLNSLKGVQGEQGISAYQVALNNGFEGTQQEWLDSLQQGLKGDTGASAYEIAYELDNSIGTQEQWIESIMGVDGLSAYEVALKNGFEGTEQEWLDSLQQGLVGKSAYDLAVDNGFEGSEEEYLASLHSSDIKVYFDTETQILYITDDGTDPTPAE